MHANAIRTARMPGLIPPADPGEDTADVDEPGVDGDMTAGPAGDPNAGDPRPYTGPGAPRRALPARTAPPALDDDDGFLTSDEGDDSDPNNPPPTLPNRPEKKPVGAARLGESLALSLPMLLAARDPGRCGLRAPTLTPPGSLTGPLPSRPPRVEGPDANGLRLGGTSTGRLPKKPPPLALDDRPVALREECQRKACECETRRVAGWVGEVCGAV
jgi:hypothetical protein